MASATEKTRDFGKLCFKEDLDRLNHLPCNLYNFHPGSHVGQGTIGLDAIVKFINNDHIKKLPLFLETPNELSGYKAEIDMLRRLRK